MLLNFLIIRNESPKFLFYLQHLSSQYPSQIQDHVNSAGVKIWVQIQISQLLSISASCEFEVISILDNF